MPDGSRTPDAPVPPGATPTPSSPLAAGGVAEPGTARARVHVVLPAALTAPGPAEELTCEAATVDALLDAVAGLRPALAGRLHYEGRPLVTVAVNGTVLPAQTAMARALADGDRVELVPPVAGG